MITATAHRAKWWLGTPVAVTEVIIGAGEVGMGEALGGGTLAFGGGRLLKSEYDELKAIATKFETQFDVVGSRAAGTGRNIDQLDLPVGKGPGTRSDIDVRIDGQVDIDSRGALTDALKESCGGSIVQVCSSGLPKVKSIPPYISITPD